MVTAKTWIFKKKIRPQVWRKCDDLCIHCIDKDCGGTEREDGMCDRPDMYREIGDVIDGLCETYEL